MNNLYNSHDINYDATPLSIIVEEGLREIHGEIKSSSF